MSKKSSLNLSKDELTYLTTFIEREIMRIGRLPAKLQGDSGNKYTVGLKNKLRPKPILNRVELKILRNLARGFVDVTRSLTLPELDRRIKKYPDHKDRYAPYIDKCLKEIGVMEKLLAKFEVAV